ncbi:MAG: response regulator [Cyanobacteria bacterium SBLK]|nr:response regulator [Cyanobacteria bacterium SBLK]
MREQNFTILIIEDEYSILKTTEEILALEGYRTISADNGEMGLHLAQEKIPDLILCDIMMPKLNGYEVLQALQADKATQMIPIIFLTAKAERKDMRQGMELGADDYLTKPFDIPELLGAVSSRLKRQNLYYRQIQQERTKNQELERLAEKIRKKMAQSQKLAEIKEDLLDKIIADFSNPISSINVALKMLKTAPTDEQRDLYIHLLQEECRREMQLLNEIAELRALLAPDKAAILQKYNLLNG